MRAFGVRGDRQGRGAERRGEPRSCVRVLSGPDELAEAIERAIGYEESGSARSQARIGRYQELGRARQVVVPMNPQAGERGGAEHAETA